MSNEAKTLDSITHIQEIILDSIIQEIIYNKDVHNLLLNPKLAHPYRSIVQFQINECNGKGISINEEGFQIGEPFNGDIKQAPILFLSSNPAFNFDEVSPRFFPNSGKLFVPEHIENGSKKGKKEIKPDSYDSCIKKFFLSRIQKIINGRSLHIPLKNGKTKAVPYWGCVRENTKYLLPDKILEGYKGKAKIREIMKYAVCMEIVPFRSNKENGVPNALDKCWDTFTTHLLELSRASVIVLVGNTVLDCFVKNFANNAEGTLTGRNIFRCTIGNKGRLVVKVDFSQGKFSRFKTFFSGTVITILKNAVEDSPLVKEAIRNSKGN